MIGGKEDGRKKEWEEKRMRGKEDEVGMFKLQIIVSRFLGT